MSLKRNAQLARLPKRTDTKQTEPEAEKVASQEPGQTDEPSAKAYKRKPK